MNAFSLFLEGFCLTGQGILHIVFVSRLTGRKQNVRNILLYLMFLCVMEWLSMEQMFPQWLSIGAELSCLCGMSRFAMGNPWSASWVAALFAVYISQLSFGVVNSVEAMIFPNIIGEIWLYPLLVLATLAAFLICVCCYAVVWNCLSFGKNQKTPDIGLLLFPGLFFFAAELYILRTSYHVLPISGSLETVKHGALLFLQVLGLGALLCTSYAYQRLCHSLQTQTALQSLSQAVQMQRAYIAEAQTRYEQTKAFRHDIRNHLTVLNGLFNSGKLDESKAYLQQLEAASASLSFLYQTNNPVVDILLGEKLGLAKTHGITAEVSLIFPKPCGIDDFDLCVIFANALDNAIRACQAVAGEKSIRIYGKRQGDFYLLEFTNSCLDEPLPPMGTGLANIQSISEKYHGAMLTEKTGQLFSLHVLLNIS